MSESRVQTAKGGARGAEHQRVGFIGLGNIGLPMAKNIAEAGLALTVFDVNPDAMRQLTPSGARLAENPAAVGRECAIVGVCVRDDHDVRQVLLGEDGLLGSAQADAIIAIHSTIRPRTVLELAAAASEHGVHVLDVGITGGAPGAMARTLCYMAGGEAALIDRCRPVFETSAKTIVHTGPLGSGMATKLCNNLITYIEFLAAFEASRLANRAGVSQESLTAVTQANGVMTPTMQAYLARWGATGPGGLSDAQREWFVGLAEKDLAITLEFARDLGVSLPATALCSQLMVDVGGLKERRSQH